VLVGREVEVFELVPTVKQIQLIVLGTDRKSVPSMTERTTSVGLCCQSNYSWNVNVKLTSWPRRADRRYRCPSTLEWRQVGRARPGRSHAVLTFEHLDARSESDPVSDIEPM